MIVVIFVSARAHMRYFRCSLVIYALGGEFQNVTASAVRALLKANILPLSYVTLSMRLQLHMIFKKKN